MMRVLYLLPSKIRYSQDSINNVFDSKSRHSNILIGQTLDDLCEGRCRLEDIEYISVVRKNGEWFTADNRRLWIFKHLERLKKCTEIPVYESYYIPDHKFTTVNDGESVMVRRYPGGKWHCTPTPKSNYSASTRMNLSERHRTLKNPLPSLLIQDRPRTQTAAELKSLLKPPTRGEIQFTAKGGIHTSIEEPEVQEPGFQVCKTFDYSGHTNITDENLKVREGLAAKLRCKSSPMSSDIFPKTHYSPTIQTCADEDANDGADVYIHIEEPDVIKHVPVTTTPNWENYNSRNLECCSCVIF